jgi:hypothetical protein
MVVVEAGGQDEGRAQRERVTGIGVTRCPPGLGVLSLDRIENALAPLATIAKSSLELGGDGGLDDVELRVARESHAVETFTDISRVEEFALGHEQRA